MIKAIKTVYDGIEFRSKLEAAWYEYFNQIGFSVLYEPEPFEIQYHHGEFLSNYLPDFYISNLGIYVEVKPIKQQYSEHDMKSFGCAYILGYTNPTIIIMGSPFEYFACIVLERYKGCPSGQVIEFSALHGTYHNIDDWSLCCYPDEGGFENLMHPMENCNGHRFPVKANGFEREAASTAWNKLKWAK